MELIKFPSLGQLISYERDLDLKKFDVVKKYQLSDESWVLEVVRKPQMIWF